MSDHPLTDEMMREIHGNRPGYSNPFDEDDMRAAYDKGAADRLEQVIQWLRSMSEYKYLYLAYNDAEMDKDELIADLKKAMRPLHPDREENNS